MNSIAKSNILNIKIRPLVTEYALIIKLMDGTSYLIYDLRENVGGLKDFFERINIV
jgi:hypothetical protein